MSTLCSTQIARWLDLTSCVWEMRIGLFKTHRCPYLRLCIYLRFQVSNRDEYFSLCTYTPKKSICPLADFSYKSLIFQHPKKCMIFDKFLLRIMGNAQKRVFVQKFQLSLILQGFKV